MNHWDTQAVHLSIEGSLWFVSNSCSLFFLLSLLLFRDKTALQIANSKLRIAISCCFLKYFPAIVNSVVLIFHFVFSVGARKLSMTGSIRNFEN